MVVLATPVYRASFTGSLNNSARSTSGGSAHRQALWIVAMGATTHHFLGVEWHLRDVLTWFGAIVPPTGVYLSSADFVDGKLVKVRTRIWPRLARALIKLATTTPGVRHAVRAGSALRAASLGNRRGAIAGRGRAGGAASSCDLARQRRGHTAAAPLLPRRSRQAFFSRWPPKPKRIAESTLSANSACPREVKRANKAALKTLAGTPSSIAASTVQRPSPESETRPAKFLSSGSPTIAPAVRSSSHDATTLPRRHTSVMSAD